MKELNDYILAHTDRTACRCGKCITNGPDTLPGHTVNLVFFDMSAKDNPDAAELRRLIEANPTGEFCDVNLFDGNEHNYQEIGGYVGDQGRAMCLMGLGTLLGLWDIMTPYNMLPSIDETTAKRMAEVGYVAIKAKLPGT